MTNQSHDDLIRQIFRDRQKMLLAGSGVSASGHTTQSGNRREEAVRKMLSGVIPNGMRITNGLVVHESRVSREADAILVDSRSAEIRWEEAVPYVPAVCAPWIIEVKTSWRTDLFDDLDTKARAARQLRAWEFVPSDPEAPRGMSAGEICTRPTRLAAVVLEGAVAIDPLNELIARRKTNGTVVPDLLVVLEAGVCYHMRHVFSSPEIIDAGEDALLAFTYYLLDDLLGRGTIPKFVSPAHQAGERWIDEMRDAAKAAAAAETASGS